MPIQFIKQSCQSYQIPVVDHSVIFGNNEKARQLELSKLDQAMTEQGIFCLVNHGFNTAQMNRIFDLLDLFLAKPQAEKEQFSIFTNPLYRGYEPPHNKDNKEGFIVGIESDAQQKENNFEGANIWPDFMGESWRCEIYDLFEELFQFSLMFHRVLPMAMGLSPDRLKPFFQKPSAAMRLLRYPPQKLVSSDRFGIAPHTDWGCLSLIYQKSGNNGLDIKPNNNKDEQNGGFVTIFPPENSFIVHVGEMVARLTNDRYQAIEHRVVNRQETNRHSLAFFLDCDPRAILAPINLKKGEVSHYPPVPVAEFLAQKHAQDFNSDSDY